MSGQRYYRNPILGLLMNNAGHTHRHAYHALEDFEALRREPDKKSLWHSLSHHLRHVVYRTGKEVEPKARRYAPHGEQIKRK
jgi:hypothetical protein